MKKLRATVLIMLSAIMLCFVGAFLACAEDAATAKYTLTFETDGGTEINPIVAAAGTAITPPDDPQKENYDFAGWYDAAENGSKVTVPAVMPAKNITYYARYTLKKEPAAAKIVYEYNLGVVQHSGNVSPSEGFEGDTVTVKDGAEFSARGHLFVGWSTKPAGPVRPTGSPEEGQYNVGQEVELGDTDITLYAQWAAEYTDSHAQSSDKIYKYDALVDSGLGAAILVRDGEPDKYGFVASAGVTYTGYDEFTFMFNDGDIGGRFLANGTYAVADGTRGKFVEYDYVEARLGTSILALDGFGIAVITEMVGSQLSVAYAAEYEMDEEYGDYKLLFLDTRTFLPLTDEEGNRLYSYVMIEKKEIAETQFDGEFRMFGNESGTFLMYENGEILNYRLELNGYGYARIYSLNPVSEEVTLENEGSYKGTGAPHDESGEWEFLDSESQTANFKFYLNVIVGSSSEYVPVYMVYNKDYDKTFSSAGDTLTLDGYGWAVYKSSGTTYEGLYRAGSNTLITFLPYFEDDDGYTVGGKMYFNVNWDDLTFNVNSTGFITDGTVITGYEGEAQIIVLPDYTTEVADNAFNSVNTEVSLISVTVPAGVTKLGKHAFENDYTLRKVIFLAEQPIEIDWSAEGDPFRWGAGNFVIVVPEESKEAYIAAWTGNTKYTVMGSEEVKIVPEFVINDGVLVRYNGPQDNPENPDVVIPDGVTAIADYVFRGLSYIKTVDLNNVETLGNGVFYGCIGLTSVTADSLKTVGVAAFSMCYSLESIALPAIQTLDEGAFSNCESLKNVSLGANLTSIGDRCFTECQIYYGEAPLFVEFNCAQPPAMGERITAGNVAIRFKIPDIAFAIACYGDTANWNSYCRHLYIESGAEKGLYLYGTDTLRLDGRAEVFGSEVMLYVIDGTRIDFYAYDSNESIYIVAAGTYIDGVITIAVDGTTYVFEQYAESETFVSEDGKYTLVCDPYDLLSEKYENNKGRADATLNGNAVKVEINGYSLKINGYTDTDGKKYDFNIRLEGRTLVYTRRNAEIYYRNITAEDGSVINLHITATQIYIFGTVKIDVGGGEIMSENYDNGITAEKVSENVYVYSRQYKGVVYEITVTLSADKSTFSYTYRIVSP